MRIKPQRRSKRSLTRPPNKAGRGDPSRPRADCWGFIPWEYHDRYPYFYKPMGQTPFSLPNTAILQRLRDLGSLWTAAKRQDMSKDQGRAGLGAPVLESDFLRTKRSQNDPSRIN